MKTNDATPLRQPLRFIVNGVVATLVHYATLRVLLDGAGLNSAGVANSIAACVGITVSFVGSRRYVFRSTDEGWWGQFSRFVLLYGVLAVVHGVILSIWSDWLHHDVTAGFLLALCVQTIASYFGNKRLVFKPAADPNGF